MGFSITLSSADKDALDKLWALSEGANILEMTAFGDFFVQQNEQYFFYSLTDACITDVTDQVLEFGLPPVSIELGDEWYQLDAQSALEEDGYALEQGQCFGFRTALTQGGDYSLDNIQIVDLFEYHRAAQKQGLVTS